MGKLFILICLFSIAIFANSSAFYFIVGPDAGLKNIFKTYLSSEIQNSEINIPETLKQAASGNNSFLTYLPEQELLVLELPDDNPLARYLGKIATGFSKKKKLAIAFSPSSVELKYDLEKIDFGTFDLANNIDLNLEFSNLKVKFNSITLGYIFNGDEDNKLQFADIIVSSGRKIQASVQNDYLNLQSTMAVSSSDIGFSVKGIVSHGLNPEVQLSFPEKFSVKIFGSNIRIPIPSTIGKRFGKFLSERITGALNEYLNSDNFSTKVISPLKKMLNKKLADIMQGIEAVEELPCPASPKGSLGARLEEYIEDFKKFDYEFEAIREKDREKNIISEKQKKAMLNLNMFFITLNMGITKTNYSTDFTDHVKYRLLKAYYLSRIYYLKLSHLTQGMVERQNVLNYITQQWIKNNFKLDQEIFNRYKILLSEHIEYVIEAVDKDYLKTGYIVTDEILKLIRIQLASVKMAIKTSINNTHMKYGVMAFDLFYIKDKLEAPIYPSTYVELKREDSHKFIIPIDLINKIMAEIFYPNGSFDRAIGDKYNFTSPPQLEGKEASNSLTLMLKLEKVKKGLFGNQANAEINIDLTASEKGIIVNSTGLKKAQLGGLLSLTSILNPINWIFTYILSPLSLNSTFITQNPLADALADPNGSVTTLVAKPIVNAKATHEEEIAFEIFSDLGLQTKDIFIDGENNIIITLVDKN